MDLIFYDGAYNGVKVDQAISRALSGGALDQRIDALQAAVGSPLEAATVTEMTNVNKVYVYTGSEAGYTAGHWYYWNGAAWTDGGVYNAVAVDMALSELSDNAVANRIIKAALDAADAKTAAVETDALKAFPHDTASGSVASFSDGADNIPVRSLTAQIVPVQAGSGDPSPSNPRAISGWTGAHIRVAKDSVQLAATYLDVTGYYYLQTTRSSIRKDYYGTTANGRVLTNPQVQSLLSPSNLPAGNYKLIGTVSGSKPTGAIKVKFQNWDGSQSVYAEMGGAAVSVPTGMKIDTIDMATNSWANGDWIQIDDFALVVEPSAVYPIAFPAEAGTVYGGTLTDNGDGTWTLTVDRAGVDMGAASWTKSSGMFRAWISDGVMPADDNTAFDAICSCYVAASWNSAPNPCIMGRNSYAWVYDTTYADSTVAQFATAMAGQKFVYPLATPQTYTLSAESVRTLLGDNNIFCDTGDVSVDYRADTTLYINGKVEALTALMSEI